MNFPVLETNRLILRQLRPEDAIDLFDYFSKDEVTKFYDIDSLTEINQAKGLIEILNERFYNLQGIRWGITLKNNDRVIGTCGFHKWIKKHFKAEVGYELSPKYWHQGYMSEVLAAVMQYGFDEMELNRIEAFIHHENSNSRKLLEKSGFNIEGVLHQYFYKNDNFIDSIIFSRLRNK